MQLSVQDFTVLWAVACAMFVVCCLLKQLHKTHDTRYVLLTHSEFGSHTFCNMQLALAEMSSQDQDSEPDTVVVATSNAYPPVSRPTDTWGDVLMDSGEDIDISQDEEESI